MSQGRRLVRRRRLLKVLALATGAGLSPVLHALVLTPRQTAGPFYPDVMPEDSDSDLTRVTGMDRPALGDITDLAGEIVDAGGRPLVGARVEIWQCDARGVYHHVRGGAAGDPGFQGFGSAITDAAGRYRFRTIRPYPYPGRTPHIHFAIRSGETTRLITQMYVAGEPRNESDFLYRSISEDRRAAVTVAFQPAADRSGAVFQAHFPIVVGPA